MATPGQPHPSVVMDRPARVRRTRGALGRAVCNRKGPTRPSAGERRRGEVQGCRAQRPACRPQSRGHPGEGRGSGSQAADRAFVGGAEGRAPGRSASGGRSGGCRLRARRSWGGGASAAAFRRRALREVGTLRRCPRRGLVPLARGRGTGPPRRPVASPPLPWGRGARPILAVASHFVMLQFLKNTCPTYRNKNAGVCLAPFAGLEIVFL